MAKSPTVEVIQDSEDELPKSSKKTAVEDAENHGGNEPTEKSGAEDGDGDGDGDEEEYEIEAILDAKHGAFPSGRVGYLVKWKGYSDEHNSWVDQDDAGNAQNLIDAYWKKHSKEKKDKKNKTKSLKSRPRQSETRDRSPEIEEVPSTNKRKKNSTAGAGRKSKSSQPDEEEEEEERPQPKKAKKTPRAKQASEERMDVDEETEEYKPMEKFKDKKSWETLVERVDTIEKIEGVLKVFFTLNNGDKVVESSQECAKHFPQKLIQFYESNLRWRESE